MYLFSSIRRFSLLFTGLSFHIVSLFWHLGTSCGPGTREGLLPAGDPETGAAAEESTEASGRLGAKKPRGNRRKLSGSKRDTPFRSRNLVVATTLGSEWHSRTIELVELPALPPSDTK